MLLVSLHRKTHFKPLQAFKTRTQPTMVPCKPCPPQQGQPKVVRKKAQNHVSPMRLWVDAPQLYGSVGKAGHQTPALSEPAVAGICQGYQVGAAAFGGCVCVCLCVCVCVYVYACTCAGCD